MTISVLPEAEIFGARLRELREKRGETVRSLATLTETSFTDISDMEHGKATDLVKVFNDHDLRTIVRKRR
jgi:transcriptional regulator with XRE-family HTH domain